MSKIWAAIIIISIIIACVISKQSLVLESILEGGENAVTSVISLTGMMCFWSGIFKVFENTSIVPKLSKIFEKIVPILFDKKKLSKKSMKYISLNCISNMLGIGNAATINGIKAIESMQEENNMDIPSDNMTTFVLLNTASIQLIPTSMIALRNMYGSSNPTCVVIPILIVTSVSLIFGILSIKILNKIM